MFINYFSVSKCSIIVAFLHINDHIFFRYWLKIKFSSSSSFSQAWVDEHSLRNEIIIELTTSSEALPQIYSYFHELIYVLAPGWMMPDLLEHPG